MITGGVAASSLGADYANRLRAEGNAWWKRIFDVQRPYRAHLRRLDLGHVLEIGCGLGRNLKNLGGNAVGVDPNADAVAICKERGLAAFTPAEFVATEHARASGFDALLVSHVLEHLAPAEAHDLINRYLPYIRGGARVVLITPQEYGYRADPTHVTFLDLRGLESVARGLGLTTLSAYSFPFPRFVGRVFRYNEFVLVARKP